MSESTACHHKRRKQKTLIMAQHKLTTSLINNIHKHDSVNSKHGEDNNMQDQI
jgi:hypothetical protein